MSIAWMQRDLPGCAELPADYPTTKMDHHHEGTHFGLWAGRPLPHHGTSRQHLGGYLVDTAGGEVFCEMPHDEFPALPIPHGVRQTWHHSGCCRRPSDRDSGTGRADRARQERRCGVWFAVEAQP
jgi:hypothetical protein